MFGELTRQVRYVTTFGAYSPRVFAREAVLFPVDYLLRRGKAASLMNVAVFVTLRCNLRCEMCNLVELMERHGEMGDPPRQTLRGWFDQLAPYRPNLILFGGEPFVRSDIPQLLADVRERGMSCGIFTNGTRCPDDTVEAMVAGGLKYVVFSIHGGEEVHNRIVGNPLAFQKAARALEAFVRLRGKGGTKAVINCMLCEQNLDDLEAVIALGERAGVDAVRFGHPTFFSAADAADHDASMAEHFPGESIPGISYAYDVAGMSQRFVAAVRRISALKHPLVFFSPELDDKEVADWYAPRFGSRRRCLFLWRGSFIYPNGDVVPCESIGRVLGNVNQNPFAEIWNDAPYVEFRSLLKKGLLPGCARCCKL